MHYVNEVESKTKITEITEIMWTKSGMEIDRFRDRVRIYAFTIHVRDTMHIESIEFVTAPSFVICSKCTLLTQLHSTVRW